MKSSQYQLTSDLLEPPSQALDEYNIECPICLSIIKPTDDQETGATECMNCEIAICKKCITE